MRKSRLGLLINIIALSIFIAMVPFITAQQQNESNYSMINESNYSMSSSQNPP
jgi:hypothetical protein